MHRTSKIKTGFPRALEIMEYLENHKKVLCMKKSWNLKKKIMEKSWNLKKNHGKIMEFCEII